MYLIYSKLSKFNQEYLFYVCDINSLGVGIFSFLLHNKSFKKIKGFCLY